MKPFSKQIYKEIEKFEGKLQYWSITLFIQERVLVKQLFGN